MRESPAVPLDASLAGWAFRNPLEAFLRQNDAAQDFLHVADILEPGLNAGRNVTCGRMRRELPQRLKFKSV
jgi:hypothetical protein